MWIATARYVDDRRLCWTGLWPNDCMTQRRIDLHQHTAKSQSGRELIIVWEPLL